MNPPLSTILLSIAEHVTDIDTANVPAVMSQQHDLLPTSPDWLRNWEAIFNNPTLLGRSRPLTRHALMHTLQSVYDSVKDMPAYRKPLADLVHAFCEKRATDRAQRAEAMWQILGEEFVLRTVGLQEVSPDATSTEVRQPEAWVEKIISLLSTTALESEVEEDDTPSVAPADPQATPPSHIPTLNSSTSSSSSSRTQLDSQAASRESGSALPSVMSILTSLASGNPPRTQSLAPHVSDVQPSESPTSSPAPDVGPEVRSVSAVVALVTVFNQLAFTPHALSEANLHLAIRIFRIIVGVVVQGKSPKARLTALQFLMRLRTDCDHRLYFVDAKYDPDNHIFNLAKLVDRVSARAGEREQSEENIVESAGGRTARARHPHDGDASRPSQGRGARPSTSLSSRSRSRVPANPATRNGRGRGLMWQLPEQLHFPVHEVDTLSEGVLTYLPPDSPRLLLPISAYLTAIIGILEHEKDWDILSYVLCHLPVQLANRHTFCGPNCRALMVKLLTTLGMGIINGQLGSDIELSPPGLKPRDVQGLAYHTLSVLICYKHCFDLQRRHLLVEVFEKGLDGQPSTIKCCLHSLSLSAFELPASVTRYLSRVLEKLSQIMSNPNMAVHILAFLCIVASLPTLYSNFTENDFKMVFGVALKYLQHHNRVGASPSGSWALSQTVRFVSYYVVYAWFLAVKLPDRARHVSYITRQLLLANEGRDEIDESAEVCFDWLARYTYGSADPRPARSLLSDLVMSPVASGTFGEAALGEKSWIFGNSVVTIRTLARLGWIEVVSRRPSGLTKFLCRVENVPLVGPGDVDPDPVSVPAGLIMDYRPPTASAPASREADQKETPSYQVRNLCACSRLFR
jgi:tuberous sclerosis protein 2